MTALVSALVAAVTFACAAWAGVILASLACSEIRSLPDGPPPGKPPVPLLVAGSAILGASLALRGSHGYEFGLMAIICIALVGCWYSDVTCGIVPDVFTLAPLAAILFAAALRHEWWLLVSALVPFVPFAIAAAASRGHGMGWGDVKLVALGGAVLGSQTALLAFAVACVVAVVVSRRAGVRRGPIAFAPYLAAAIGVALTFGGLPS